MKAGSRNINKVILVITAMFLFSAAFCQSADKALLIGKWQSTEDKYSLVEFTATNKTDRYKGVQTATEPYYIRDSTIIVGKESYDMKYDFYVTKNVLNLVYLPRGNTLAYKRVKNENNRKVPRTAPHRATGLGKRRT